jgi:4,5-DOPA dioxygenase extradiol
MSLWAGAADRRRRAGFIVNAPHASMPAAFIGHGSPMNTLELNDFTRTWRALGRSLPRPRAVLSISAHWFIQGTAVTAMARPKVIHDFYGFPKALFDFDYPAPGSPEVAREVADLLKPDFTGLDEDSWGLDHGTWSVLAHVFPDADVPVVQLSIHAGAPLAYHLSLGARLAPLRERGIFVLGSGNVVHNLRLVDWKRGDEGFDWADRFDARVREVMTTAPGDLPTVQSSPDYALSVPTAEHFLPVAYLAGLCAARGEVATPFAEGRSLGSLSMTSYVVGMPAPPGASDVAESQTLPDKVPPEQTNM